jgi:hypothetical protein
MTHLETKLWNKIKEFNFDDPGTQLTFAARLQRENGWTQPYTLRVIDEYKKFIFFCCTSTSPVTPSDPVDQAWHLHLTYTKSYWNNLCRDTLGKEIHHNPTKGGKSEQERFSTLYKGSHDIYVEYFGCHPPSNIWHDNTTRFGDVNFQRVNTSRNWVIKKPFMSNTNLLKQLVATTFAFVCIQASGEGFVGVFILVVTIIVLNNLSKKDNDENNRGNCRNGDSCSSYSCAGDSSVHGHSGCSSHGSDSGCSSGCSGCGGGCGGD